MGCCAATMLLPATAMGGYREGAKRAAVLTNYREASVRIHMPTLFYIGCWLFIHEMVLFRLFFPLPRAAAIAHHTPLSFPSLLFTSHRSRQSLASRLLPTLIRRSRDLLLRWIRVTFRLRELIAQADDMFSTNKNNINKQPIVLIFLSKTLIIN